MSISSSHHLNDPSLDLTDSWDAVESYFECITTCSVDDGECITSCVEKLRDA